MEYYQTLTIKDNTNNSTIFSCTTNPLLNDNENYRINLEGWKTYTGTEIKTVQKLLGAGSYVESIRHNERELVVTASLYDEDENELEERTNLLSLTQKANKEVTVRVNYYEVQGNNAPTLTRTEWFEECLISGLPTWERMGEEALLGISIKVLNPFKKFTDYTGGSSTSGETL
jgi:hypothetical protein